MPRFCTISVLLCAALVACKAPTGTVTAKVRASAATVPGGANDPVSTTGATSAVTLKAGGPSPSGTAAPNLSAVVEPDKLQPLGGDARTLSGTILVDPAFIVAAGGGNIVQAGQTLFTGDLQKNGMMEPEALYNLIYKGKNKMPGYGKDCAPRVRSQVS